MKVTILKSCATTLGGRARSLPKGSEHDLPDDLASALVAGGLAAASGGAHKSRAARARKKAAPVAPEPVAPVVEEVEEPPPAPEPVVEEPEPEVDEATALAASYAADEDDE